MVVKPQLDDVDGLNWAFGIKLMDNHWEDGKMASFNGISFDGFDSLNSLMKANSYNEISKYKVHFLVQRELKRLKRIIVIVFSF